MWVLTWAHRLWGIDLEKKYFLTDINIAFLFFEQFASIRETRVIMFLCYRTILEWTKESEHYKLPGLSLLSTKTMEDTKMCDLNIRLGYPYLYCHQGNCEHLLIFTDMRLTLIPSCLFYLSYFHLCYVNCWQDPVFLTEQPNLFWTGTHTIVAPVWCSSNHNA